MRRNAVMGNVLEQLKLWRTVNKLGSPDEAERKRAFSVLLAHGVGSAPALRRSLLSPRISRTQISAATLLYLLGDSNGLPHLCELLRSVNLHGGELELEEAFLVLPVQDTRIALRNEWLSITDWSLGNAVPDLIATIWTKQRDPSCLDLLCRDALRRSTLFLTTAPQFGEPAVLYFDRMLNGSAPEVRLLAIQALRAVRTPRSFSVLARGLRDFDPTVREAIPRALVEVGGKGSATDAVLKALDDGFASTTGMSLICEWNAFPTQPAQVLLTHWNPNANPQRADTPTVRWIVEALTQNQLPGFLPIFCSLLEKRPAPSLTVALLAAIGSRLGTPEPDREHALSLLRAHVSSPDNAVRDAAASALERGGVHDATQFLSILNECLSARKQTVLRSRMGKLAQAAYQMIVGGTSDAPEIFSVFERRQFAFWSVQLLTQNLSRLTHAGTESEVLALSAGAKAALDVLSRLHEKPDPPTRDAIVAAFHFSHSVRLQRTNVDGLSGTGNHTEIGEPIRAVAAETLARLYGEDAFPLFVEAAFATNPTLQLSGIEALAQTGATRALLPLQSLLLHPNSRISRAAQIASDTIRAGNPELLTLLRASEASDPLPQTLLRPIENSPETRPQDLLRPAETPEEAGL